MPDDPPWNLARFGDRFDAWVDLESPTTDLATAVTAWIERQRDDPYKGMRRAAGFLNLWFGGVPGTDDGYGCVVACSYWIHEATRTVECDSFATQRKPL